jgi:hypothetical protein
VLPFFLLAFPMWLLALVLGFTHLIGPILGLSDGMLLCNVGLHELLFIL